jgi:hypothetical protein
MLHPSFSSMHVYMFKYTLMGKWAAICHHVVECALTAFASFLYWFTVNFEKVSDVAAVDIAVDPSDPSNVWVIGPIDYQQAPCVRFNGARTYPLGGQPLKWDGSDFKPVAGINLLGYHIAISNTTHYPWITDSCGELKGWSYAGRLRTHFGTTPKKGYVFDIATVNSTGELSPAICTNENPSRISNVPLNEEILMIGRLPAVSSSL